MREFPTTVYIPEGFPVPGDDIEKVRRLLWVPTVENQKWNCVKCGSPIFESDLWSYWQVDLHEGIVSRGDVRGWPKHWKVIIFNRYNCVVIHRYPCHKNPPSRDEVWEYKCRLFGEDEIRKWYESLPFKILPRRF